MRIAYSGFAAFHVTTAPVSLQSFVSQVNPPKMEIGLVISTLSVYRPPHA